jgi:drug/metabolite transporter (DMT)-like permease/Uma2 family endonuclease
VPARARRRDRVRPRRSARGLRSRALLLVALAQLAIGAAAVFARFALVSGGPLAISAARLTLAAVPLLVLAALRGRLRAQDAATEKRLAFAGALLALHFATWIASLNYASVAISTLLVCTTPVWTEAYAVLRRRRIDPYAAASILGALAGVAIVVGAPDRANTPLGIALALAGAVAIAAYLLVVRATGPRYDTLAVTARTYGYAAIVLIAASLLAHDRLPPFGDARAWGGIVAMALFSQLFGHTALNAAVRVLSATFVSTVTLLEPVIAAVLAAWLFAERLSATTALGAAVILAAIGVALRGEQRAGDAGGFGIDPAAAVDEDAPQDLPPRADVVIDRRGNERNAMLATIDLPRLRTDIECAVEIVPPRWIDDDELVALEERYEPLLFERFADGTLLVTPPTGGVGGRRSMGLSKQVAVWGDTAGSAVTFGANAGFKFPDRALLSPDATYIRAERWHAIDAAEREKFPVIVPDACFEIVSKSDRMRTTLKKIATYLRHGVRLVVLVDPYRHHVYVARAGEAEARDLGDVGSVDCSPEMPGFVLDVAALQALD